MKTEAQRRAIFLDRDGVINLSRPNYVKSWDEFIFLPGVFEALRLLAKLDAFIIVATNQSAINRGIVPGQVVEEIHRRMCQVVHRRGGRIDSVLHCPHRPDERCECRKPRPGLLQQAAMRFNLDLTQSYLIGDALSDIAAGVAVGCRSILVLTARVSEQSVRSNDNTGISFIARNLVEAAQWILAAEGRQPTRRVVRFNKYLIFP